ncbi:MAG: dihydrofolate reductase [Candidatus Omnitrophica bacterium]|nr:dihydrofolate reductase [Candidatus Omnitrophota bacterium]
MIPFSIIVAVDSKLGIGKSGGLPWHLPADLKYFKMITTATSLPEKINAVVMGRKTWESIPMQFRPLPKRLNVVISRQKNLPLPDNAIHAQSLDGALSFLRNEESRLGEIFVIGGAQIFNEAIKNPYCQKIYLTRVESEFVCDTFFPDFHAQFSQVACSSPVLDEGVTLVFCQYERKTK